MRAWETHFDERQLKEIRYCLVYDDDMFRHGTDGHNLRLIVAKMAKLLDMGLVPHIVKETFDPTKPPLPVRKPAVLRD
jgi:hypothetical protein